MAMKVWLVYRESDMTEGRGPMVLDSAFATRELAEDYAHSQEGVMGRTYQGQEYWDWQVSEIEIKTSAPVPKYRIRKEALAKLTPEEISALGVKDEDNG